MRDNKFVVFILGKKSLHKKWNFSLRVSPVNVIKSLMENFIFWAVSKANWSQLSLNDPDIQLMHFSHKTSLRKKNHQGRYFTLHLFILALNIWTNSYCFVLLGRLFHIHRRRKERLHIIFKPLTIPIDTGRKLNVHKAFRRGPECLLDVYVQFTSCVYEVYSQINFVIDIWLSCEYGSDIYWFYSFFLSAKSFSWFTCVRTKISWWNGGEQPCKPLCITNVNARLPLCVSLVCHYCMLMVYAYAFSGNSWYVADFW